MTARRHTLALGGLAALTVAALTTGTAAAQDVPPVPPIAGQDHQHGGQGTQVTQIPGGTLVQGPHGQEYIPHGVQGPVPQQHDDD